MKFYRYLFFFILISLVHITTFAREIQVKSFEILSRDLTARTKRVDDLNGKMCALIKVALPVEDCKFEGDVVRHSFDVNEYLVYMPEGSKRLRIKCPGFETLQVELTTPEGDIGVKSEVTYSLKLAGYEDMGLSNKPVDPGANYLILDIMPKTGLSVKVDGMLQTVDNGQVMTFLKYGTHNYAVEAEGYAPAQGTAVVGKDGNTTIQVHLKSIMATLMVTTETKGATIKINGQAKGTGNVSGQYAPGIYQIEIGKDGYRPYTQTIELAQRDNRAINIPALTPIYGALNISYKPIGATVFIDGKDVGTAPIVLRELLVGKHEVSINKDGYSPLKVNVEINEGQTAQLDGSLTEIKQVVIGNGNISSEINKDVKQYIKAAEQGDAKAQCELGTCYFVRIDYIEAVKWYKKAAEQGLAIAQYNLGYCYQDGYGGIRDNYEAVKWYKKAAEQGLAIAQYNLGNCYAKGQGISQDYTEAVKWYSKAAEQGDANAQYNLGWCYDNGKGVGENYVEAAQWYSKAAEQGNEDAITALKKINSKITYNSTNINRYYNGTSNGTNRYNNNTNYYNRSGVNTHYNNYNYNNNRGSSNTRSNNEPTSGTRRTSNNNKTTTRSDTNNSSPNNSSTNSNSRRPPRGRP